MKQTIVTVLLLSAASLSGCGDNSTEPQGSPQWELLSESSVDATGGTIANDGITVEIPAGAFDTQASLTLEKPTNDDFQLEDPRMQARGTVFRIDGVPKCSEPLTVELTFDPVDLPADDECFVYLEEECYVSVAAGWVQRGRPLTNSVVDRDNGTVTVLLPADDINPAKADPPILRNFIVTVAGAQVFHAFSGSGEFEISWLRGQVDEAWLADLVVALDDAKAKLENLGMVFTNSESDRIDVHVRPPKTARDGEFIQSKLGIDASYILISPTITGDMLRAVAGHELFHLLQMCYGACGHYFGYDYLWLCEASSTWFEPVFLNQPEFIPTVADANRNFIGQSLETETLNHGYGASRFLTCVTDQLGESVVPEILTKVQAQSPSVVGAAVFDQVLADHETTLSEMFTEFAQKYITADTGHPGWTTSNHELFLLTPSRRSGQVALNMPDLSAQHINTALDWGNNTTWGRLTISLNQDASEYIKCFVYSATAGGGPWTLLGELETGDPFVILDFGRNQKTWVKVVAVRAESSAPYDQNEQIVVGYDFEPQDGFPVHSGGFDMEVNGTLVSGEPIAFWFHFYALNARSLSENSYEIEEIITQNGWRKDSYFTATVDFTNRKITSWFYHATYDNPTTGVHWDAQATGGEVPAYWQNEVSAQYELYDQDVCDQLVSISYVKTVDGVVEDQLDTAHCDNLCDLKISIRD